MLFKKRLVHLLLLMTAAFWSAVVCAAAAQDFDSEGSRDRVRDRATMATPRPEPTPAPGVVPTPDRLAPPPTVPAPTQADEGEQLFWLHCQPCHGDRGQGLTEDWRMQYPMEDRNCWNSGCHGERPYGEGFALPTVVPAVIGDNTLTRFPTMESIYHYISVAMPYFFPGDLTEQEYLAITAHLAREHGVWDGRPLTPETLAAYRLGPLPASLPAAASAEAPPSGVSSARVSVVVGAAALLVVVLGGLALWRKRAR